MEYNKITKYNEIVGRINNLAKERGSFKTASFGDNWLDYAKANISYDDILMMAWVEGRRAQLLQYELKKQMILDAERRLNNLFDTLLESGFDDDELDAPEIKDGAQKVLSALQKRFPEINFTPKQNDNPPRRDGAE